MSTHRAWVVVEHGEPHEALQLLDVETPELGPGQLRLRVSAATLALPDVFMCRGSYPLTPTRPFTPGQEVVGTVVEAGPGTTTSVGTKVMAMADFVHRHGGFAELTIANEDSAYAVPPGLDDVEASGFLIAYLTAWIGLVTRGRLEAGQTVVVLGASGGSGSAAVQLAAALGARVIGVVSGDVKADHCRAMGASDVVDRSKVDDVLAAVRDLTGGRGADLVYDPVGGELGTSMLRGLANEGRFLLVGFAGGAWPTIDAHLLVLANTSVVGVYAGAYTRPERIEMMDALTALVARGALRPPVTPVPFADLPAALAAVAAAETLGRPVLVL